MELPGLDLGNDTRIQSRFETGNITWFACNVARNSTQSTTRIETGNRAWDNRGRQWKQSLEQPFGIAVVSAIGLGLGEVLGSELGTAVGSRFG